MSLMQGEPRRFSHRRLDAIDRAITAWMARHGLRITRIGLGVVFFWFGVLKLFPGASPAEPLVRATVSWAVPPEPCVIVLGIWESLIGLGLISGVFMRATLALLFLQMPGTLLPLIVVPDTVWQRFPFELTMEGQYILKNFVLIGAALVLGATVRGGRLVTESSEQSQQEG
jgi:uncharacterized membrane protein YkgB